MLGFNPDVDPVVTSLAVDKSGGVVKHKRILSGVLTPRVRQRRLRTKILVSHANQPLREQIAPPTIDTA
jgi:hypothetical protein